jgi:signal transduction histidine kinase
MNEPPNQATEQTHISAPPDGAPALADVAVRAVRQLARLRFDLHDGPQQDVALLGEDLRMFRGQLEQVLDGNPFSQRLIGRLDDLQARLVALDGDLRRISSLLESPFLQEDSMASAIKQLVDAFRDRTEIEPELRCSGNFEVLSDSQQITLLALVREALNNIREHSDARHVWIELEVDDREVRATVRDDGSGFDPETALVRAARDGHLGIVGMHERVQMLGGSTRIDSRPGGPTIIQARLPAGEMRWIDDGAGAG